MKGLLYLGTEFGLYVSFDAGDNWQRFQLNLPVSPIYDLKLKGTDLVVATHGRSFWVLDDVTAIHQVASPTPLGPPRINEGKVAAWKRQIRATRRSPSLMIRGRGRGMG